jgi:hypothetical protein
MTKEEIIEMARQAGFFINDKLIVTSPFIEDICISPMLKEFAKLVTAKEREAILQMFEHAPALVDFAKNDQGGCLICGFTPEIAIKSIRARGEKA